MSNNSFAAAQTLQHDGNNYRYFDPSAVAGSERLSFAHRILLENLLRYEDGLTVSKSDIEALLRAGLGEGPAQEIAYRPARVLMQDFTGVPAMVDLATMRDAMEKIGGDPKKINPLTPVELVIDHSVQVDVYGEAGALQTNTDLEYQRNAERYQFLKWGQQAFGNLKVVPPGAGICHQVNLETLARVAFAADSDGGAQVYPDTVVGTDSHTTMINGLGVLGWGVGGIEAEAAMLGQPISMLVPKVVGFKLSGALPAGVTATDLVLTVTQMLRAHGVVGKFVEFYGPGVASLSLADRATLANMAPEYGATCGLFPVDNETLRYLRLSNRSESAVQLVEKYYRAIGMFYDKPEQHDIYYPEQLELDMSTIELSLAGPKRPQDKILLPDVAQVFQESIELSHGSLRTSEPLANKGEQFQLSDGDVVIAAITSCTNTSNPAVMMGAGLLAQAALERGLKVKPWVKTSLAPGSKVVTSYLVKSGLLSSLEQLGFNVVGYGCTTCIGNSGPLDGTVSKAIGESELSVAAVLSGNRNFEGRVHPEVKMNFLASPPLVVAFALAGSVNIDLRKQPLGQDSSGKDVFLSDIWPSGEQLRELVGSCITQAQFAETYDEIFTGDSAWQAMPINAGQIYQWQGDSTYVRKAPFFDAMGAERSAVDSISGARVLALLGDSVTTDHISPAGSIAKDSPAADYLREQGVAAADFNSYGSRRGNHEIMMRGTFANIRLRNQLAPGTEGGITRHMPSGEQMSIFAAAMRYQEDDVPAIVIAGKEYGTGSSRDWAAKGPKLLGVQAAIAESFERIHRTNLVGMGILPLQFQDGANAASLGLDGSESFAINGIADGASDAVTVIATKLDGQQIEFSATVRIDTPQEVEYFRAGGILQYVLQKLAA